MKKLTTWVLLLGVGLMSSIDAAPPDVEKWIGQLRSPSPSTRKAAAEALSNAGVRSDEVIRSLIAAAEPVAESQPASERQAALAAQRALQKIAPGDYRFLHFLFQKASKTQGPQGLAAERHLSEHGTGLRQYFIFQMGDSDVSVALGAAHDFIALTQKRPDKGFRSALLKIGKRLDAQNQDWELWSEFADIAENVVYGQKTAKAAPALAGVMRSRIEAVLSGAVDPSGLNFNFMRVMALLDPGSQETSEILSRLRARKLLSGERNRELIKAIDLSRHGFAVDDELEPTDADQRDVERANLDLAIEAVESENGRIPDARSMVRYLLEVPPMQRGAYLQRYVDAAEKSDRVSVRQSAKDVVELLWDRRDPEVQAMLQSSDICRKLLVQLKRIKKE